MISNDLLITILLSIAPISELRGGILYGLLKGLDPTLVFIVSVISNILISIPVFLFFKYIIQKLLHIKFIEKHYSIQYKRALKHLHPQVEKYGVWALAIFIGIPLPGTGVYTAAIGAAALDFEFKEFLISSILGVLIAGIIVTAVIVTGNAAYMMIS